jgi:excisionase family DNA binding protein
MSRKFYTLAELEEMGIGRRTIRKLVKERRIRTKKLGRRLHLHPKDVDRAIGWADDDQQQPETEHEPSPWAAREAEELLG